MAKHRSSSTPVSSFRMLTAVLALAFPVNGLQIQTARQGDLFPSHPSPPPPTANFYSHLLPSTPLLRRTTHHHHRRRQTNSLTALHLLKGLVPTVDDEIRAEIDEALLSPIDIFQRELSNGSNFFQAYKAVQKRMKDKAGDYENKYKILSDSRSYSNRELIDTDHYFDPPTLQDLNQVQPTWIKVAWVTGPFRLAVFVGAFFFFPVLCRIINMLVEVSADEFDIINDQFTPGIGILYGTFVALTLDILYERQNKVQENASVEASLLSQVTQNVISLFRDQDDIGREACQIIADQVRIIVYRSRGSEMLNIMRSDPYARLLSLIDHYQRDRTVFTPHEEALIDGLRSEIPGLMEARAKRLSDEASALPPTHFLVLLLLTSLSLIGFTAATLTVTDANGNPPLESGMVFAGLTAVYVLFYNFCRDMNDPFDGVYQIKRSSAASYLLQIKWIVANQPYGPDIKFDTRGLAPVFDGNEVYSVGQDSMLVDTESLGLKRKEQDDLVSVVNDAEVEFTRLFNSEQVKDGLSNTLAYPEVNGSIIQKSDFVNIVESPALDAEIDMHKSGAEVNGAPSIKSAEVSEEMAEVPTSSPEQSSIQSSIPEQPTAPPTTESDNIGLETKIKMDHSRAQVNSTPSIQSTEVSEVLAEVSKTSSEQSSVPEQPAASPTMESDTIGSVATLEKQPEVSRITVIKEKKKSHASMRKEILSHFQTTSGFGDVKDNVEGKSTGSSAPLVPAQGNVGRRMQRVEPRKTTSMYFRNMGGFHC